MTQFGFWNFKLLNIRLWEWILLILFYAVFTFAYAATLYITSEGHHEVFPSIYIDYGLKAIYTIPIWWLIFKAIPHWKRSHRLLLHLLFLPVFVFGWQYTYYFICDQFEILHLVYPFSTWDVYIPGLFYVVQFGIFHVNEFYGTLRKKEAVESELRQLALQSELKAIKAQLNPHFLYNTFNTISASVSPEQEQTREMIASLSDLFRYQLKSSKVDYVELQEEIEFLQTYLDLEKARFGNRLEYEIDIDDNLTKIHVPPMILQPIVENAVRHGIASKIEGGKIKIIVSEIRDAVRFEILDNGVGFDPDEITKENGVGLTNTQKRLEKRFNSKLIFENLKQGGTSVRFDIPKE